MAEKITFFFAAFMLLSMSISHINAQLPAEAFNYPYDGYAACFYGDVGRDRRDREANECESADVWDYSHWFRPTCNCFTCE